MNESSRGSGMHRLPSSTIKLVSSAQVITSVSSVVKELMENSLDAGATCLEIHLDGHGLDRIEVKDNGQGIKAQEVQYMCQRSYTSKISDFSDLDKLNSYGFRGEALFSICAVADVSVTTISSEDSFARTYKMDHNGVVTETKPANLDRGTSIVVTNLFKNLPVRKQFLTSGKRKAEEIKKVETVVKTLALVNCAVKIRFTHNKFTIWQKASVCSLTRSFIQVLPPTIVKQLKEIIYKDELDHIEFTLLVPKQDCNIITTCLGHSAEAIFLFVNLRPVREKEIEKVIHEMVFEYFGTKIPAKKYPAMLASIILPPDMIDINLEPNKTKVMVKDLEKITKLLRDQLSMYYYGKDEDTIMKEACVMEFPKRKMNASSKATSPSSKKLRKDIDGGHCLANDANVQSEGYSKMMSPTLSGGLVAKDQEENAVSDSNKETEFTLADLESVPDPSVECREVTTLNESQATEDKSATVLKFLEGMESKPVHSPQPTEVTPNESDCVSKPIVPDDPFDILRKNRPVEKLNVESEFFSQPLFEDTSNDVSKSSLKSNAETSGDTSDPQAVNVEQPVDKMDLEQFSLSCWSRGDVRIGGKKLEGTTAIGGVLEDRDVTVEMSPTSCDRSVSSQMGQKNMSAFTKFAREMRVEIVKAQPGMSFPKIAQELSRRWQELQEEDKKTYEELALADKKHKKTDVQTTKRDAPPVKRKSCENPKSFKPMFVKKYHTVEKISVELSEIRERIKCRYLTDFEDESPEIVANVDEDLSIVKGKSAINIFSCHRLNEAIKFHNDLNMFLDLKVLEKEIEITKKELGHLWDELETLDSAIDVNLQSDRLHTSNVICDERITKNGFRIEKIESSSGNRYTITDVAKQIAHFGVSDLKEILVCISENRDCRLRECRPLSVINFIRSETVRSLVGQNFTRTDYTIDLYKHWLHKICKNKKSCPHHRPVVKQIFPPN